MSYLNKTPISDCRLPNYVKQLSLSLILLLAFCAARSQNIPSFFISDKVGCNGILANVNFIENSTGPDAVVQRDWDLGNGTIISNGANTVTTDYLSSGKYYISLTVTFANGDVKTTTDSVEVHEDAILGISGKDMVCLTSTTRLQYNSSVITPDAIAGYKWQIDGDSVAGTKNLDYVYRIPGTHMLQFSVTTINGCTYSTTKQIVIDYIATYFGVSTGRYCGSGTITFSNYSINIYPLTSTLWSYGDGTTSSVKEESHAYAAPGNYTVKLVETSMTGCMDSTTFTDTVKILTVPTATINGPGMVCLRPSSTLQYTNTISTVDVIRQYKWAIDGGTVANTPNLNYNYRIPGSHTLAYTVKTSKGCESTVTKTIFIDSIKTNIWKDRTKLCGSDHGDTIVMLSNLSQSASTAAYTWSFGDGSTSTGAVTQHNYPNPGSYTLKLYGETINGCKDSTIINSIRVSGPLSASISGKSTVCLTPSSRLQYNSNVVATDPITSYKWVIDADSVANTQNLDIDYRKPGNHTIVLTVSNGICEIMEVKPIIIDSVRTNFSMNKVRLCGDSTVVFTNLSANAAATSYTWTFGDGKTFNGTDTSHTYAAPGSYSVKLYAETINGCKDSTVFTDTIKLFNKPTATISGKDIVCFTPSTKLQYSSNVISADAIIKYKWMIDGNAVGTTANLNYNFRQKGKHTISFEATTATGCTATASKDIIIDSVKTNFGINAHSFCGGGTVNFSNLSKAGSVAAYTWLFGDGSTYTGINAIHNYAGTGLYSVKLTAVTTNGCTDSTLFKDTIRVFSIPKVLITGDSIHCKPGIYNYDAASTAVESIDSYQWYADGIPAGTTNSLQHYFSAGNHTVSLKVISLNGCSDSVSKNIIVDSVKASFSTIQNKFCGETATVQFNNRAAAVSNIVKYEWSFGDNSYSSMQSPAHIFQQPGKYNVQLIVTTEHGCTDTIIITGAVEINKNPVATLSGDTVHCATGSFTYKAITGSNAPSTTYDWNVNGSTAASVNDLSYNFSSAGIYNVLLTATDNGCSDTSEIKVVVDTVNAAFSINNAIICGETGNIQFTNTSTSAFVNETYTWNFGDGQTGNDKSPLHLFTAGKYLPSLQVTTVNGCTASFNSTDTVKVYSVKASIDGDAEKCAGSTIQYNAVIVSQDAVTGYSWKLDNTSISNNDKTTHDFNNAGTYQLQLDINTTAGCNATAAKTIIIHALPAPNASADTTVCKGSSVQLRSFDGSSYQWQPASLLQNANTAAPTAVPSVNSTFYVTVTNQFGCTQNDTVTIKVDEPTNLTVSNNKAICIGDKVQLKASGNGVAYLWNNEASLDNKNSTEPIAQPTTSTTYQVIAFSGNICKNDTASVTVAVGNIPTVNAGADKIVEANSTVQLNPSNSSDETIQYNWGPADGLNCTNCANPSFTAVKDISYTLTVKTAYGCTSTDEIFIKVMPAKAHLYMPTAFSPNNDRLNDFFYVKGYGMITVKSMIIFNRLGQKVFEKQNVPANDPSQGWNGLVNGEPTGSNESFVYMVTVIDKDGQEITLKGTVTVLK